MQNTSKCEGFKIFDKIAEEKIGISNENYLNLYMLNTENKLFNYVDLYNYILQNICQYVFDRRKNLEVQNDTQRNQVIILEALEHFREVNSDKDKGAGGELGEILLYMFLEQDLKAPKLLSKVELKTSTNDYIKGCDAIHYKFRRNSYNKKILQLVIGEAKITNKIEDGIKKAFDSINSWLSSNIQDYSLLDTHLTCQLIDKEEAQELKEYILGVSRKKKETIFGIFIGYSIDYKGHEATNDEYDIKIIEENTKQVLSYKQAIIDYINKYQISNYQFNFFFLPFHDAIKDRAIIIKQLKDKKSRLSLEEIRNG